MRLIILLMFILSVQLFAESTYSIKKILNSSTFEYYKDSEGDYIVDYITRTARKQQVIVRSNTNTFQGVEIREIISIAKAFVDKPVPENLTNYLLIDNYSTKYIGNWAIHKKGSVSTIIFVVKLPFNSDKSYIESAITETAEAADALEKALEDEIENNSD
ncbi:MAG: hypothetical protein OCD02_08940 [Spirochaetaceae bacterium]